MENDELLKIKDEIVTLKDEIKLLEQKKKQLKKLEIELYNKYFDTKRDEYAFLTDIPNNPTTKVHALYPYSTLNIDEIGKLICKLFEMYEHKHVVAKRSYNTEWEETKFDRYAVNYPILVIGEESKIADANDCEDNIIIEYNQYNSLKDYPTSRPVVWDIYQYSPSFKASNYGSLIGYSNDLSFDYKNYEFIKELIYSLAYYQKTHDIKYMNVKETREIFKKIYKK